MKGLEPSTFCMASASGRPLVGLVASPLIDLPRGAYMAPLGMSLRYFSSMM